MYVLGTKQLANGTVASVVVPDFVAKARTLQPLAGAAIRTTNGNVVGHVAEVTPPGAIPQALTVAWRSPQVAKYAADANLSLVAGRGGGLVLHGDDVNPSAPPKTLGEALVRLTPHGGRLVLG